MHKPFKFHETAPGLLRGSKPHSPVHLAELWTAGVRTIISLEEGFSNYFHDYDDEMMDWVEMGGVFHHIQCSNIMPMTPRKVAFIYNQIKIGQTNFSSDPSVQGPKVYVHCYSGVDRTGFVCAYYKYRENPRIPREVHWKQESWEKGNHKWYFWWKRYFLLACNPEHY